MIGGLQKGDFPRFHQIEPLCVSCCEVFLWRVDECEE
jgi:hypothetical protein